MHRKFRKPCFTVRIVSAGCRYDVRLNDVPVDAHEEGTGMTVDVPVNPTVFSEDNLLAVLVFPGETGAEEFKRLVDEEWANLRGGTLQVPQAEIDRIDAYFAPDEALLDALEAKGKSETTERLRSIGRDWRVDIVYQDNPKGLGHAVGCAREAVGNEPFTVLLPHELMSS